jgi:hypothetical protein
MSSYISARDGPPAGCVHTGCQQTTDAACHGHAAFIAAFTLPVLRIR